MRHPARGSEVGAFAWILLWLGLLGCAFAHAAPVDITSQLAITRTGLVLNRTTNTFDSTTTLANASGAPISAPLIVVVNGLPTTVALANKAGNTATGAPYFSPALPQGSLGVGAAVSFVLKFANPQRTSFTSTLQVLNGVDLPTDPPALISAIATGGSNAFLIGRVAGASNLPITLQVTSSRSCVAGVLAGGAPVGSPVPVTTDASGYFSVSVAGINPGDFVAVNVVTPTVTAQSACVVSARDNDSWPKAFPLDGSPVSVQDLIDAPGKTRWYRFSVIPGQRIEVKLSGLPADYDIAVFKDIGAAFASQFNPTTAGTSDLLKLTAEYAPSVFSPSVFSPSVFSPSVFSPSVFSPSVFSPSVFSPSVFSPSVFSPSVFSPSVFSPSVFSPSVFSPSVFSPSVFSPQEIAQAFSTAQTRSVISVAATPGTADESTVVNTWNNTGNFYVRVMGHVGAFDTTTPFTLTVTKGATTCVNVTDTTLAARPRLAAAGLVSVFVADSSKVPLDAPLAIGGTLRDRLTAIAKRAEVNGVVVDVAADARVSALKAQAANNPACPFAKNLVASEIKSIVDSYRANPLRYIVLVGNDDAIPFFRFPDESGLGEENGYVPPVESNSPSEASLRLDYVLSQDAYGSSTSISLRTNDYPVPGLAVGRLVETPDEIGGILDAYVATQGVVAPKSSLVTGYDFLADAAAAVQGELQAGIGAAPDALITPNGKSPLDPASWTATQLAQTLFGARHDVIFLAGHFSANSALAADFATSILTTDLAASTTDFTNAIVFSAGCHSGYNLVDGDAIAGVTQPLDWAQAFARKGATLVAGTGYQYGDTDFLEYSERIYSSFSRELRAGSGAIPVGEALVKAKLDYLAVTSDIRGIPEKALLEATLFGLPMLAVNMPSGRGAGSGTAPVITPAGFAAGPALSLALKFFDLALSPSLSSQSIVLKNTSGGADVVATWFSGPDGVVTKPGEPALPLVAVNVTPTDSKLVLRGVGFRGGTYADVAPMFPFSGAPTTELRGVHIPFVSPTFYPAVMWTPNYFGALAGSGGTQLLVTPVQHRVASVADGTSTQRRFSALNVRLFYSGNLSQAALSEGPTVVAVGAQPAGTGIAFAAQVIGDPAAGIQQVWVTYTSDGANAWTSLDLTQCVAPLPAVCGTTEDSRLWMGQLASSPPNLKYFVQAVNGVGLVALEDNRGAYFGVSGAPPSPTSFTLSSPPTSATYGDTIRVAGTLTSGGVPVAGRIVTINIGGTTQIGVTAGDGTVTFNVPPVAVTGSFQLTAAFAGDEGFQSASTAAPLTVTRAASSLAPFAPVGATLSATISGNTQPLQQESVAFAVDGPGGPRTIYAITDYLGHATLPPPGLPAGSYTVTQASYGGNATYAASSIALSQQFAVAKTPQAITFAPLPAKTEGDPDFGAFAVASSTLPVTFSASGSCTIAGNVVHLTATGTCTITATQPGDANYDPAQPVAQTFTIASNGKNDQVITFGPPPTNVHVGDPPVTITATSTSPTAPPSGLPIIFSSLSPATCATSGTNGATVTPQAAGNCVIAANQAGNATYNPAPQATLVFSIAPAGTTGAQFTATGSMNTARSDHTATLLEDGRVLVAGGFGPSGSVLNSAELYCPDNATPPPDFVVCPAAQRGTFATTANLLVASAGQTATRLHDGTVLLIGGANSVLQWFTPSTQTWNASAPMTLADRSFHTATLLASGKVFVAGGVNAQGATINSTFVVDTSVTPWTIVQGPDLNFPRESHSATALPDGTVLIAGGRRAQSGSFVVIGEYERYDPSGAGGNGAIIDVSAMAIGRFWHAAEIAGTNVVVAGGSCDASSAVSSALRNVELFSFTTGAPPPSTCNAAPGSGDLQRARRALTLTRLLDGTLAAIGGEDQATLERASSELLPSGSSTWLIGPSLTNARSVHQSTLLLDGRVLVTGGTGATGVPLASAEILSGAGGAGGGGTNQQPIANAGPDQTVAAGATVQLTSAGSSDPEGRPLTYFWSFVSTPAGSTAHLTDANAANPTFVADTRGVYIVQLIVNDGGNPPLDSVPASVRITAGNRAPVAVNDSYTTAQDTPLNVNAASGVLANDTDADGDPLTAALVTSVAHGALTLNANGSFSYTPSAGYSGPDSFTYRANDGTTDSNTATVSITVTPTAVNHPPVANAGTNQNVSVGALVQLSGACTDADNDPTTPTWSFTSRPAGSNATLSSTSILNPTFTADLAGSYVAQLVCNDTHVDSAPSSVTITASAATGTITLVPTAGSATVGVGETLAVTITLSAPAGAGGQSVSLSSDDISVIGIETPSVTIAAGQTQGSGNLSGVAPGSTTVRASASGFTQGTLAVGVTNAIIFPSSVTVPLGASAALQILVSPPAPAGGLLLTLSSNNPGIASVGTATITIPAGQTSGNATVNGVAGGSTSIVAQAPGYGSTSVPVTTVGASAPVQWAVANGGNDHYYQFIFSQNGYTWDDARVIANNATYLGMPGYLATVTSQAENDFIHAMAMYPAGATGTLFDPANPNVSLGSPSIAGRDALTWLAGSDAASEGTWRWADGPEAGSVFWNGNGSGSPPPGAFAFWNNGQPDNFQGGQNYLQIRYSGGRWDDTGNGAIGLLDGTNPDGTQVRAPVTYIIEYSPPTTPPSTYTVTNLNDNSAGSLRDAVIQANQTPGPATITFADGLTGTIHLTSGQMQIGGPMTIAGPGADKITIDAGGNTRIFSIFATDPACPAIDGPDYLVSISGLTLANARNAGAANTGGAIFTEHSLVVDSVVFQGNVSRQGAGIGDLVQYPGQILTITNSQFVNNIASGLTGTPATPSGQNGAGVAIIERCVNAGVRLTKTMPVTVTIANSVFSGNHSQPTTLSGTGGAIESFSSADITIVDSRIVDNHIDVPNPPVAGQVYRGGGVYATANSLRIVRTEISGNSAIDATANDQTRGGAVFVINNASDTQGSPDTAVVQIIDSTISGNAVDATAGAILAFGNVAVEIDNSTIASNTSGAGRTGGILMTTGATSPASASNAAAPTLRLVSSIVANNTGSDVATNSTTIPGFTLNAANSLIRSLCSTCNITLSGNGNLLAVDPLLDVLASNGGPTQTHALLAGSPAIDAGSNPLNLTTDQRGTGFPRVVGAAADMGAYESTPITNHPPVANAGTNQNVSVGALVQLNGACTDADNDPTTPTWSFTSRPAGSNATLSSTSILNPTFTADLAGSYVAQLVCNDTHVNSAPASVTITASAATGTITLGGPVAVQPGGSAPLAITISPAAPAGGLVVTLSGNDPTIATPSTPTITIAAGQTSVSATIFGVNAGTTTITAQAAGYASAQATVVTSGTPFVFTVTNLNDSGAGSLRDAIAQANAAPGPNIIAFQPDLSGTIVLTSGQIRISDTLTIAGPGAGVIAIDGNANDRIFTIKEQNAPACPATTGPNDYVVAITGLTFQNARVNSDNGGGAIHTAHSLVLDSVTFVGNVAKVGGGVNVNVQYPGQYLSVNNAQFTNNLAKPLSAITGIGDGGGAIAVTENCSGARTQPVSVSISSSTFSGNRVQPVSLYGLGGAIAIAAYPDVTITDSRIVDNHIDAPNPAVANQAYLGAGIFAESKSLLIQRSEIAANSNIDIAASGQARGGGLALDNDVADLQTPALAMTVTIVDSTISGNADPVVGGAMWVNGNVAVELDNSTVTNNSAPSTSTGGIQLTTNPTNPPGANNASPPTLKLVSSILANNAAGTDDLGTNSTKIPAFTLNAGNSLIRSICSSCNISVSGAANLIAVDPQLDVLADNGGPTRTHALLAGSPAIDAGSNPLSLTTDQRGTGFARVVGTVADIGAYEFGNNRPPVANAGPDQTVNVGQLVQLNGSCTDADGDPTTPTWSITSAPPGSTATLSSTSILNPTFTPNVAGNYVARLVCNDTHVDGAPSTVTINTAGATIALNLVNTQLVGLGQTAQVRVVLSPSAPTGGKTVSLSSDNPAVLGVAAPGTVTIVQGGTEGVGTLNGASVGSTTIHATANGYASASLPVTVTANLITVGGPTNVTLNSTAPVTITLAQPAGPGGLQVSVTSSDPTIISVDTPTVTIPAGQTSATATLRGKYPGNVTVIAQAPGYASGTSPATVGVTLDITEATVSMFQFDNRSITIALTSGGAPAVAPPGGLPLTLSSSNPACVVSPPVTVPAGTESTTVTLTYGGTATLPCTSTVTANGPAGTTPDTVVVTVNPAPGLRFYYAYDEANGYTGPIRVGAGLEACLGGNLRVEAYNISTGSVTNLTTAATVTITSSNSAVAVVSPSDSTTPGTTSVVVTIPANSYNAAFCLAGVAGHAGQSASLTASATGLIPASARTVNVVQPVVGIVGISTNLTAASPDEAFNIYVGIGQSATPGTLYLTLNAPKGSAGLGITVSVPDTTVAQLKFGTQVGASVTATIPANSYYNSATNLFFDPLAAGTTTVSATATGFLQSGGTSYTNPKSVSVAGTALRFYYAYDEANGYTGPIRVGAGLEACLGGNLRVEAYNVGTGNVTNLTTATAVTITSSNSGVAVVSPSDNTTAGTSSVVVTIPANSYNAAFCLAGIAGQAGQTASLTATATGLIAAPARTVNVVQPVVGIVGISTNLTTLSPDAPFNVYVGIGQSATPGTLYLTLNAPKGSAGLSVTVSVPDTTVAQLKFGAQVGASVTATIPANSYYNSATNLFFDPLAAGTTTVSATATGFLQSGGTSYTNPRLVSVAGTALRFYYAYDEVDGYTGPIRVGAGLEACLGGNLRVEAYNVSTGSVANVTTATAVTITSSNSGVAVVSPSDNTTAGTSSVVVTIPANSYNAAFCLAGVAGQAGQTASLTATATGLIAAPARTVNAVQPVVGIIGISTTLTTLSPDEPFNVYVGIGQSATPGTLYLTLNAPKGSGGLNVTVSVPDTNVAQLKFGAQVGASVIATIPANSYYNSATNLFFDPLAAGTTTVSATMNGFLQSGGTSYTNPRAVSVAGAALRFYYAYDEADGYTGPIRVGAGLEACLGGNLRVEAYNVSTGSVANVTAAAAVTITSSNSGVAVVSPSDNTTAGTASVVVTIPANSYNAAFCLAGVAGQVGQTAVLTATSAVSGLAASGPRQVSLLQPLVGIIGISTTLTTASADDPFNVYVGIGQSTTPDTLYLTLNAPKGSAGLAVTVSLPNTSVAQLKFGAQVGASVIATIPANSYYNSSANLFFDPLAAGTTTLSAGIPGFNPSGGTSYTNPRSVTVAP